MKSPSPKMTTINATIVSEPGACERSTPHDNPYWQWRPNTWLHQRLRQTRGERILNSPSTFAADFERWVFGVKLVTTTESAPVAFDADRPKSPRDSRLGKLLTYMDRRRA